MLGSGVTQLGDLTTGFLVSCNASLILYRLVARPGLLQFGVSGSQLSLVSRGHKRCDSENKSLPYQIHVTMSLRYCNKQYVIAAWESDITSAVGWQGSIAARKLVSRQVVPGRLVGQSDSSGYVSQLVMCIEGRGQNGGKVISIYVVCCKTATARPCTVYVVYNQGKSYKLSLTPPDFLFSAGDTARIQGVIRQLPCLLTKGGQLVPPQSAVLTPPCGATWRGLSCSLVMSVSWVRYARELIEATGMLWLSLSYRLSIYARCYNSGLSPTRYLYAIYHQMQ